MKTYLFAWNPNRWLWPEIEDSALRVASGLEYVERWSIGNTRSIRIGDRVFFIHLGATPRGIFGSGWVKSNPFDHEHWDTDRAEKGDRAYSVMVQFDVLLVPGRDTIIKLGTLQGIPELSSMHWATQSSGITIPADIAGSLEELWTKNTGLDPRLLTSLAMNSPVITEGARRQTIVNRIERDPGARRRCIEAHGCRCSVCGFDFEAVYGEVGEGFIHVHHLVPISEIDHEHIVDPENDLRPVCPNCHAMLHRKNPPYTIEFLSSTIRSVYEETTLG